MTLVLKIKEMECVSCSNAIIKQLKKIDITDIEVDVMSKIVHIEYDENKHTDEEIMKFLKKAGFTSEVIDE